MDNHNATLRVGRNTLGIEARALQAMADGLDDAFVEVVNAVFTGGGRLVVTGIGKTAIVAQKIVATLNSTGTPALFLHAADAIHGDLGMIQPADHVLLISKSGETAEIKVLALLARQLGSQLIAMVGREGSSLAELSDYVLLTLVPREADPNDLAPTTSTTLQMAMGDALATALLARRGFTPEDFGRLHPGGSLGKQLYLTVGDLYPRNQRPVVYPTTPLHATVLEMTAKCLGATAVLDPGTDRLLGIITDGDLRRTLSETERLEGLSAADLMTRRPKTVTGETLAVRALETLRRYSITQLPVVDAAGGYLGFVHLHDLVREGLV